MEHSGVYIVVTPFFPTEDCFRGSFIYDQVQAIKRTKKFRDVLVFRPGKLTQHGSSYVYHGIKVHIYGSINPPSLFFNGCTNSINAKLFLDCFTKLGIKPSEVSVVHAHTSSFGACALALKKKNRAITTLLQHHDGDPYTVRNGKFANLRLNAQFRAITNIRLFEKIDIHVSISSFVERHLLEFPEINPKDYFNSYRERLGILQNLYAPRIKKSVVLPNGVDTRKFYPRKQSKCNSEPFTIGCIANFQDLKDHITLIKAVHILSEQGNSLHLRLVGSGPTFDDCLTYVRKNNLENIVFFEPEVQHHELVDYYHSLDLFVLPSYFEGLGCVYLEATACGVPFIGCEGQGIEDYILPNDRHLWLCPPSNPEKLACMIEEYIKFRPLQALAHSYDIDVLVSRFVANLLKGD